jgi:hypothetical protein
MGGVWNGVVDATSWTYFHGEWSADTWPEYIAHLQALADDGFERLAIITIVSETERPSAKQRADVAAWMKDHEQVMSGVSASAMVMDSALARSTLTAVNWVFKKPFPEHVFARTSSGLRWLAEHQGDVSAERVLAAIRAAVPPDELVLP